MMPLTRVHRLKRQNRILVLWTKEHVYVCDLLTRKAASLLDTKDMSEVHWAKCVEGLVMAAYDVTRNRFDYYDVKGDGDWEHDIFGWHDTLLDAADQRMEEEHPIPPHLLN